MDVETLKLEMHNNRWCIVGENQIIEELDRFLEKRNFSRQYNPNIGANLSELQISTEQDKESIDAILGDFKRLMRKPK